jgi:hypothetical protein
MPRAGSGAGDLAQAEDSRNAPLPTLRGASVGLQGNARQRIDMGRAALQLGLRPL